MEILALVACLEWPLPLSLLFSPWRFIFLGVEGATIVVKPRNLGWMDGWMDGWVGGWRN